MKMVVNILIVIVVIIAIPFIIALFVKKEYVIEREITIDRPQAEVFDYIKHLKNQDNYSKWVMTDPAMKKEFKGVDGTIGFVYAWNGNKEAGQGEQELIKITEGEGIDVEIRFKRPMEGIAYAPMKTELVSDNQTKVIWGMRGKCSYPMNFMNLFMDNMLGKDIDISLVNLKNLLEKN